MKDLFLPPAEVAARRIVKVKKPHSSSLVSSEDSKKSDKFLRADTDSLFPYKFLQPIAPPQLRSQHEAPRSKAAENEVDSNIDKQLVSPNDIDIDYEGLSFIIHFIPKNLTSCLDIISKNLPTLMSIGAGIGVALHTILNSWGTFINVGQV